MNIPAQIEEAERLYKSTLEEFLLRTISGVNLESHGIDHHRRVWAFAREIISIPGFINPAEENGFVKKLLIAAYLHDSGMVIDTGPRHGIHSRSFCEKYLTGNGERTENFIDLLDAIELHDNKDYRSKAAGSYLEVILNVADDLDALGYIGIYRYLEIYL
jgi:HD superfamily phosphodiesterase